MQFTATSPVIGLDLAKSVFQLHIVDVEIGEIQRRQIKRASRGCFVVFAGGMGLDGFERIGKETSVKACKRL